MRTILLILFGLFSVCVVRAQSFVKVYLSDLKAYPVYSDLVSGLIVNGHTDSVFVIMNLTLTGPTGTIHVDRIYEAMLKPGIFTLNNTSGPNLQVNGKDFADSLNYIPSGTYTMKVSLVVGITEVNSIKKEFTVPPYLTQITQDSLQQVHINPVPYGLKTQTYICRKNASTINKQNSTVCYLKTDSIIAQHEITPDSISLHNKFLYKINIYHNGRYLGGTDFTEWRNLGNHSFSREDSVGTKLKSTQPVITAGGTVAIEYGYSNIRFPGQQSSPVYTRFYFQPMISVMGIPFSVQSMISTENNSTYPVNSFRFGFDAEQFTRSLSRNAVMFEMETERTMQINKEERKHIDKMLQRYRSLAEVSEHSINSNDSATSYRKRAAWRRKQSEKDHLRERIAFLEGRQRALDLKIRKDSIYLHAKNYSNHELNTDTLNRFISRHSYKRAVKMLLAVKSFQVGITSPEYSKITLYQTPIRGIHADIQFKRWFITATAGNRTSVGVPLGFRNAMLPRFSDKTYCLRTGIYDRGNKTTFYLGYFFFKNMPNTSYLSELQNTILCTGIESRIINHVIFKGEFALSYYYDNKISIQREVFSLENAWTKNYGNKSFTGEIIFEAGKNTELSGKIKQIGSGYYSLGIPFLRNDIIEYSMTWRQFYWYRQIETECSYLRNSDNLSGNKSHTTTLKGYGFSLKTHFKNRPNLITFYKPFNSQFSFRQNYIEPDSLPEIITQQFYVLHFSIIYNLLLGKHRLNSQISYNTTVNTNSTGITYRLETFSGSITISDVQQRQLRYLVTYYNSSISINNALINDFSVGGILFRILMTNIGGTVHTINDGKKRFGLYAQTGISIKKLSVNLRISSDRLLGDWTFDQPTFERRASLYITYNF